MGRSRIGRFRASNGAMAEINIVPLVDVVLVLLIIFMLTAHVMEFGLEVNVPQVVQVRDTAEDLPVITITRDAKLYLNEQPVRLAALASEIHRRFKSATSVYVRADRRTVYDPIVQVISTLNQEKFGIKLVAKPEEVSGYK